MRYQTAIFDMDGTILETLEDMCASVNVTMDHVGYPRRTMDEVRRFVGNGAAKLIERCMPAGAEDPRYPAALEFYRAYYAAHAQIKTGPYPGIPELLNQLRREGVRLAVVSNKPDEAVRALTERYFPGVFRWPLAIGMAGRQSLPRIPFTRRCVCWAPGGRAPSMWVTLTWMWTPPAMPDWTASS